MLTGCYGPETYVHVVYKPSRNAKEMVLNGATYLARDRKTVEKFNTDMLRGFTKVNVTPWWKNDGSPKPIILGIGAPVMFYVRSTGECKGCAPYNAVNGTRGEPFGQSQPNSLLMCAQAYFGDGKAPGISARIPSRMQRLRLREECTPFPCFTNLGTSRRREAAEMKTGRFGSALRSIRHLP